MNADPSSLKSQALPWQQSILLGTHHYFSEMSDGKALRPVWQQFFSSLPAKSEADTLNSKRSALLRQIRDNGITYNVYANQDGGLSRPWMLDLLPFIIEQSDWDILSSAVAQRAQLLNHLMNDVYGEQRLFKEGMLPHDLVYGHSGYLPAMMGTKPAGGVWLHRLAFDFGRSPDGNWWLIANRVQAPSGLGYALENRVSISRTFRRAFREMNVEHLAGFFRKYIDALQKLSPRGENSRIALMTPGPYNETYFEHTYLARYLGILLVEGSDLVVRGNEVFLKTVNGLQQIDVLIRRTDDQWLDPLELREDSQLGVAGLLQAIRNCGVIMVNMPGGGWLEGPALHGFMPALCRSFLNEDLIVPSVPSWWCGELPAWHETSDRLDELVIRETFPNKWGVGSEPVMGSGLENSSRETWKSRISKTPHRYTLQELIPLSRAPVWTERGLEERSIMLRLFAVTDGKGGYHIMPGGLTRVATEQNGVVSMQRGGSSMDTWVCVKGQIDETTNLKPRLQASDLADLRRPVSSRAAEHLFWLGRYTERASFSLRLISKANQLLDEDDLLDPTSLSFLHELCSKQGLVGTYDPSEPQTQDELEQALLGRFWYSSKPGAKPPKGLASQLLALSGMAGQLRDRLSQGHWRLLSEVGQLLEERKWSANYSGNLEASLEDIRLYLMALHGEQADHMTRDTGWRFLQMGRQIEKLVGACEALLSLTGQSGRANEKGLSLCIALADSTITYRSRYQHRFEWLPAMDLLIFDEDLPYSVRRILYKLDIVIDQLPGDNSACRSIFESVYQGGELPEGLSLESLQPPFPHTTVIELRKWLKDLLGAAHMLSDLIGAQYFRLAERADQMIIER